MTEPKTAKSAKEDVVVPMLVWREADYERAVAVSEDEMLPTFRDWQEQFTALKRELASQARIVLMECDPDEVAEWCRRNGRKVTTENRAAYVVDRYRRDNGL